MSRLANDSRLPALILMLGLVTPAPCSADPRAAGRPALPARFELSGTAAPAQSLTRSPYDPFWVGFPLPNLSSQINAMVPFAGGVAVGGGGHYFGTIFSPRVALWDGAAWRALGSGVPSTVFSLVVYDGKLVAGGVGGSGSTPGVGEKPAIHVWDGLAWSRIGSANGIVYAMATHGGDLYVGGTFTSIDGVATSKVARWDGSSWHAVGAGFTGASTVKVLCAHDTTLVAGGTLPDYQGVAQWDGAAWSQVGEGLKSGASAGTVGSLASDGTTLYAGGTFNASGGSPVTSVATWDGVSWTGIPGATLASDALALYGGLPMATVSDAGAPRPQLWDGASWQAFNHPNVKPLAYGALGAKLLAGGTNSQLVASGTPLTIDPFFEFDGAAWAPVQQAWTPDMMGVSGIVYAAQVWHGTLYVGGVFRWVGARDHFVESPAVAGWDGTAWVPSGDSGQYFDLAVWSDSLVGAWDNWVSVWDGSVWRPLAASTGTSDAFWDFVWGLTLYQGDLIALGPPGVGASTVLNGVGRWTGSDWVPLGAGIDDGLGSPQVGVQWDSKLVIGGAFANAGGAPARNLAYWDGAAYHELGGGVNNWVNALVADGADLLVGGSFTEAGGESLRAVARWDGSQWHAMGTRARLVNRFRAHGGTIYAVGRFLDALGNEVAGAAVWDGQDWQLLGSGLDPLGTASNLEFLGDDLYLVGSFGAVSGHPSRGIAQLPSVSTVAVTLPPVSGARLALAIAPNPARGAVRLSVTLPAAGPVRLSIHDVSGREVARLLDGAHAAGSFTLTWDGRIPSGLYFARLQAPGERRTTRLVRIE